MRVVHYRERGDGMFKIDVRSRMPIHMQLQKQIVRYVSLGILAPNEQLPSVRSMAQQLGINPNTVQKAYSALEMNGVIYTVASRGVFVSPDSEHLNQIKKIAGEQFREAVKSAKDTGLSEEELVEIVHDLYKREG